MDKEPELIERFPQCYNLNCSHNMGAKHIEGYSYLDNTCYFNSDIVKDCKGRIKENKITTEQ